MSYFSRPLSPIRVKILHALKAAGQTGLTLSNVTILLTPISDNPAKAASNALYRMREDSQVTLQGGLYRLCPGAETLVPDAPVTKVKKPKKGKKDKEEKTHAVRYTIGFSASQDRDVRRAASDDGYALVETWLLDLALKGSRKK